MALSPVERVLIAELKRKKCSVEDTIVVLQTLKTQQDKFQFLKWVITDSPDEQLILRRIMEIIDTQK